MKTLLITGASSGIGYATAVEAANQGWRVIACGRNIQRLEQLTLEHYAIEYLAFDLNDKQACHANLANLKVDTVILNAGTAEYVDVDNFDTTVFERVFNANYFSALNCLNVLLPNMRAGSQLLFVDSLSRLLPFTKNQAYGSSKAALYYLAKSLDVDLKDRHIAVKTVSPCFVKTPLTDKNTFDMPMCISAEEAAIAMMKAVNSSSSTNYFPFTFSIILRVLSQLPEAIKVRLAMMLKGNEPSTRESQV
jgi:short-subunit dehydrogenase